MEKVKSTCGARGSVARLVHRIERAVVRFIVRRRLFNPWFTSREGVAFLVDLFSLLKQSTRSFSRATRKAGTRFYVTQPLFAIPFKRWRFKRQHGFYPPSMLAISPTRQCNLSCPGCFGGGPAAQELSFETVSRIVTEANRMGLYFVVLIGGEPLCWPPLLDLVRRHRTTMFAMFTNGTLVTPEVAARFAALGNVQLGFSIEGFEQATDQRRGAGVYQRVMRAMDVCRDAGVHFGYSVTVARGNNDAVSADGFVDAMIARGCFYGWYFQYMPIGCTPDVAQLPTAEQREYRRQRFKELRQSGRSIALYDFLNDGPLVGGCLGGGKTYLHINADGGVEPCAFYPFAADNIHDRGLLDVLQSPFFRAIRQHQLPSVNPLVPCPIVDHPAWLREVVAATGAQPTQPTANLLLDGLQSPLEAHAAVYRSIADAAWQKEFTDTSA